MRGFDGLGDRKKPKKEEDAKPPRGGWQHYIGCEEEDFVNCAFAEHGDCLNPRHVATGYPARGSREKFISKKRGK